MQKINESLAWPNYYDENHKMKQGKNQKLASVGENAEKMELIYYSDGRKVKWHSHCPLLKALHTHTHPWKKNIENIYV